MAHYGADAGIAGGAALCAPTISHDFVDEEERSSMQVHHHDRLLVLAVVAVALIAHPLMFGQDLPKAPQSHVFRSLRPPATLPSRE